MNTQFLNLQSYPTFGSLAADMTRSHAHQIDLADRDRAAGGCYAPASHPPFIRHLLRFPVSSETQLDVALQAKRQLRKHELATRVGISLPMRELPASLKRAPPRPRRGDRSWSGPKGRKPSFAPWAGSSATHKRERGRDFPCLPRRESIWREDRCRNHAPAPGKRTGKRSGTADLPTED